MNIEHIAIPFDSEELSDKFFKNLLGLKKARFFTVSAELSKKFFKLNEDIKVIRYVNDNLDFEVIISKSYKNPKDLLNHLCLKVENRENIIEKANQMGLEVIKVPRTENEGYYLFIKDFCSNLYEIK